MARSMVDGELKRGRVFVFFGGFLPGVVRSRHGVCLWARTTDLPRFPGADLSVAVLVGRCLSPYVSSTLLPKGRHWRR